MTHCLCLLNLSIKKCLFFIFSINFRKRSIFWQWKFWICNVYKENLHLKLRRYGKKVEEWTSISEVHGSSPPDSHIIIFISFSFIFSIFSSYLKEINTCIYLFCNPKKFSSAAGWIRTADLQGGWMYSEHRRLNAAPGITHQYGSYWNTKVECDTSTIKWCLRPGPIPTIHFLVLYSTCS